MRKVTAKGATTPSFAAWNAGLARATEALGSSDFTVALEELLRQITPFQMMNGFLYTADGQGFDLHNERIVADRQTIVDHYLAGAYILDPFYDATRHPDGRRFIAIKQLAPDNFEQSEYYRRHYEATGITDEVGFLFYFDGGDIGVLSLCRVGEVPPFDAPSLHLLTEAAPIVCALGERHDWPSPRLTAHGHQASRSTTMVETVHPLLTKREQEIVTLILKGHSTLSIAEVLSLSRDTVKVHRRKIYAKLQISSQAELFRVFMLEHRMAPGLS